MDVFNDSENIDIRCYSLFNRKKEFIYDGKINIWVNKKNIAIFQNKDDINAVNILKSKPGYCIVSRSKLFRDVSLENCLSIDGKKISETDIYSYSPGDIILSKLPGWKSFLPCKIKSFHDKKLAFGEATLNLIFISCPESELTIAWNYSKMIIPKKSVITYKDMDTPELNNRNIQNNISSAPFVMNSNEQYLSENTITQQIEVTKMNNIFSGLIDKYETSECKQILKYNLCWVKPYTICFDSRNIFGKKNVTVAATSFSNNFTKDFLPNVQVLKPEHFNNIFKIQQQDVGLMNVVSKNKATVQDCNIEPQTIKHFKGNIGAAKYYLERNNYITYTGLLSDNAKKYLFNINNQF